MKEKGYGPNLKYVRLNQKQPNKKYVNENIFENIDTEEKAYWLGFMFADGCINRTSDRIELSLKEEDLYKDSNIYLDRKFNLYNKFAPLFRDK